MKNLNELQEHKTEYDKDSQLLIDSLTFAEKELNEIGEMKRTQGWKVLDKKIREQLAERIEVLVRDDVEVNTLLALLKVADTKTIAQILEAEISKIIPE